MECGSHQSSCAERAATSRVLRLVRSTEPTSWSTNADTVAQ